MTKSKSPYMLLFLILSTLLPMYNGANEETKAMRRKNYEDTFNFILDLKSSSAKNEDFITKMHALFCPSQPICNAEEDKTTEQNGVIGHINDEILIGNKTENVSDLSSVLGICCAPCDCSDSCEKKGNCCPSKQNVNSSDHSSEVEFSCVQASSMSYLPNDYNIGSYYFMVKRCFADRSNETLVTKCETPSFLVMDEIIPVTSLNTGRTYWNVFCAACNADSDTVLPWQVYALFKMPPLFYHEYSLFYPTTVDILQRILAVSLIYIPPFAMEDNSCLPETYATGCGVHAQTFDNNSIALLQLCDKYYNPVMMVNFASRQFIYRNIFCLFCEWFDTYELRKQVETSCDVQHRKLSDNDITALLDFNHPNSVSIQQTLREQGGYQDPTMERCDCHEVYDFHKACCF